MGMEVIKMSNNDIGEMIRRARHALGLTLEQVGDACGVGKSTVRKWETGYIRNMGRDKIALLAAVLQINPADLINTPANLIPLDDAAETIPLYDGIACGAPSLVDQQPADRIKLPTHVHAKFAVICHGSSMEPRVQEGDVVYIRPQPEVHNGQIAAVTIRDGGDAEATLKRVYQIPGGVMLSADNPAFPPMTYIGEDAACVHIEGLAVAFTRSLE